MPQINILDSTVVPTSDVPNWTEKNIGFKPARSTVFRWSKRGCRGKKLKTFRAGGRVCTTVEALLEFFSDDDSDSLTVNQSSTASEDYLTAEGC